MERSDPKEIPNPEPTEVDDTFENWTSLGYTELFSVGFNRTESMVLAVVEFTERSEDLSCTRTISDRSISGIGGRLQSEGTLVCFSDYRN